MSKLKRKKSTVEEARSEQNIRIKDHNDSPLTHDDVLRSSKRTDCGHWWTSSDLTELEKLWASALQAVCPPFSGATAVCSVPELPQPSTRTRKSEHGEQAWCSLDEEVSALPGVLTPSPSPGPDDSSHPPRPSLPTAALGVTGGCVPIHSSAHLPFTQEDHRPETPSAEQPDAAVQVQTAANHTEPQRAASPLHPPEANQRERPSLWKRTERPDLAMEVSEGSECRSDGNKAVVPGGSFGNSGKSQGLEWRVGTKPHVQTSSSHNNGGASLEFARWQAGKEDGKESGKLFGSGIRVSGLEDECPPKTGSSDIRTESTISGVSRMESRLGVGSASGVGSGHSGSGLLTDTTAGRSGGGCGSGLAGAGLECCPMCLMPFPKGFSQMECDGHLAQCLSEMNADMVW